MKKRVLSFVLALTMICALIPGVASAYSGTQYGDLYYEINNDNTVTITDCDESAVNVDIPAQIDGKKVTSIGYRAFYACFSLRSITIPSSITSIGDYAFTSCIYLENITIPDSVTSIGNWAFSYCDRLMSVTLPESVTSIGERAFYDCNSLTSVTIPNSVTSIGDSAFSGCNSLTSVTIPNSVTSIGDSAFSGCNSLTSVIIPNSVTSIGEHAFTNCYRLETITISYSVTSIGEWAFSGCKSLTSISVDSGNPNYSSVDGNLFNKDKTELIRYAIGKTDTHYTISNSVTSIGNYAFSGCNSLTSVIIPNSVTSIGDWAFDGCTGLSSITIPDSVTSISIFAFDDCDSLTSINVDSGNPNYSSVDGNLFNKDKTELIRYAIGSPDTQYTIPDSVTRIGSYAFSGCTCLISVTIPDSVTTIGNDAFNECSSLTSITIPDSVTSIGNDAFEGCKSLTSVTISNSVTSIDIGTFEDCSSLTSVIIPDSVTSIGYVAFSWCSSLTSVTIPDSVTSIDNDAFKYCNNLTIHCYQDSYAMRYAIRNKIPYHVLTEYSGIINDNSEWSPGGQEDYEVDDSVNNNSLGLNSDSFKGFNTGGDTLRGPRINILGKGFYLFELPINMSLKPPIGSVKYNEQDEKFEIMMGKLDKTALANVNEKNKTYHELKEFINYCGKKTTRDTWNRYQHLRKVLKDDKIDLGFSFNATPAGYFELDKNGKFLEGSIVYVLNMDMNVKHPIPAAPILYIKVGLGVDATGKFGIKSIETNAYSLFGSLELDVSPYVGVGAGSSKFASIEGGAKLKLGTKLELIRNKKLSEIFSADMTGSLYLKAKALAFINVDKKWDIAKVSIYPDFGAELNSVEVASYDDMVVMGRDYMAEESVFTANDKVSLMGIDSIETSTFKTNVYPYAEPQLVKLNDGRELLVWLDNDPSRSDINCSVLKYSINNGTAWSQPADIYNNGAADFAPSVAVTENGAAIVWQKANSALSDSASLNEMAREIDLYYSEFDGAGWSAPTKLTDNNSVYEFAPDIASDGTNITVAWVENSENDCFALSGTNSIYTKTNGDNWANTTKAATGLGCVTSAGVTYMDGAAAVAYTVDTDGNVETTGDIELYEYYGGAVNRITEDEVIDYGLTMGDGGYSWIHDNQLWERNAEGVSLIKIPIMPLYLGNAHIMSNGTDRAIVWEQTEGFTSDLYAMYYDSNEDTWGEPVRLTEDNKKIRESSGYMTSDGAIRMAFGQAEVDEGAEDIYGKCNLMVSSITEKCDIEVVSADCDYTEYVAGEEASIVATVCNNSSSKISSFDVAVTSDGKTVAQTRVEKEIISGGSDYIEIPYTLPSDLSNKTITVTITPADKTDEDLTNNSASFEMGFADIEATAAVSGNTVTVTVKNSGCLPAENVVCTLTTADGTLIGEKQLGAMAAGSSEQAEFTADVADSVVVTVVTDSEENLYANNNTAVIMTEYERKGVYAAFGECEIGENQMTVNATVVNDGESDEDVTVVVAAYADNELKEIATDTVNISANAAYNATKTFGTGCDTVKIFVWDSLDGMKPYGDCISIDVTEE